MVTNLPISPNFFFEEFFKDFFAPRFERRREYTSLGSGVLISSQGNGSMAVVESINDKQRKLIPVPGAAPPREPR